MNLQTIKSMDGSVEYVLLPIAAYQALRHQITEQLKQAKVFKRKAPYLKTITQIKLRALIYLLPPMKIEGKGLV